jgi:hypothetical protein
MLLDPRANFLKLEFYSALNSMCLFPNIKSGGEYISFSRIILLCHIICNTCKKSQEKFSLSLNYSNFWSPIVTFKLIGFKLFQVVALN